MNNQTNTNPIYRYLVIDDPELYKRIQEKNRLVEQGREISKEIDKLENERNKVGMQIQKLKDKIVPATEDYAKPHLGEFEMATQINPEVDEKGANTGKVSIEIVDQVEDFKQSLREKMKEGKTLSEVKEEIVEEAKKEQAGLDSTDNSNINNENITN